MAEEIIELLFTLLLYHSTSYHDLGYVNKSSISASA